MKREVCRADVCLDRDHPGWSLRVFESQWAGLVGSMWRGELRNPDGAIVHAPQLQTSTETIFESVVAFLSAAGRRLEGKALVELARADIEMDRQPDKERTT